MAKDKKDRCIEILLDALQEAKTYIIELTNSDSKANEVYYPKFIDAAIIKVNKLLK